MRRFSAATALIALVLAGAACARSSSPDNAQASQPAAAAATGPAAATPPAASQPATEAAPGEAGAGATGGAASGSGRTLRDVTIPAGTVLRVRLETHVASDTSHVEDPVRATLTKPVAIHGSEAIPAGSALKGIVTSAKRSGKVKGRAEVAFNFDALIVAGGEQHRVRTRTVSLQAPATKRSDAVKIGAPAAGGAILGALLGGKKGALIGGAVGGGAGTAVVLATPGKEVSLAAGSALTVKLLAPVTVRVPADR